MNRFAIVTDGTCTLPNSFYEENEVSVIPLHVIFGNDDYISGVDLSHQRFYELLSTRKQHPTTSAPSLGECHEVFSRVLATGTRDVIAVTMDSSRSLTFSVVRNVAQSLNANISVIDSKSVSGGLGMVIAACVRARRDGRSFQDTVALAERLAGQPVLNVYVDTLEFLRRSGRVPTMRAFFGSLLQIRPILKFAGGDAEPVDRVRTRSRGIERVKELTLRELGAGARARVCVLHTKSPHDAQGLADWAQENFHCLDFFKEEAGPVLGAHVGPGVVAIGYLKEAA
jgi:DegV family protein with EDD domain